MDIDAASSYWGISPGYRRTAWEEAISKNDAVLSKLKRFSTSSGSKPRQPRIAQLETSPRSGLQTVPAAATPTQVDHSGFPRSVGAFTTVFDQLLQKTPDDTHTTGTVALKDMVAVRGHANTCGTGAFSRGVSDANAVVTDRLLDAGWIIVGMTNMHAMAFGTTGLSSQFSPAVNALDSRVPPGGSSSGSAVAVAAGDVRVALGTDTGGSIRIPAALNGVVGFKPTFDRIPVDGVVPLAPSLDHVGPFARTVIDAASAFAAMDGNDESPLEELDKRAVIRIGIPKQHFLDELDSPTRDSFDHLLRALDQVESVAVTEFDVSGTEFVLAAQMAVLTSEALRSHVDLVRDHAEELPDDVRLRFESGMFIADETIRTAYDFKSEWTANLDRCFEDFDVLLTPTLAMAHPRVDQPTCKLSDSEFPLGVALSRLTSPFNLSGHPAITIPFSEQHRRIPLGVQLVTAKGYDYRLLAVAEHLESQFSAGTESDPRSSAESSAAASNHT